LLGYHYRAHFAVQVGDDQAGERQDARQDLVAVDHEQLVGMARQLVEAPQVARRRLERHVLAHRDVFEVHQRAHRALGKRQRRAQLLALFGRQRAHHFLDHRRRQVAGDVGELVGLQRLRRGDQLAAVHAGDERLAHRLRHLDQDVAVAVGLHQIPDRQALLRRQRLEHEGDVGGVGAVEAGAQFGQVLHAHQFLHLAQVLLQVVGFEPLLDLGHAQGICTAPMRARMVSTRPAM
jgi:hypothetical protein